MSHRKALVLALIAIVGGLVVSVTLFANTSSSASILIGEGGSSEFGFTVGQKTTATTVISDISSASILVASGTTFGIGDHILINGNGVSTSIENVDPATDGGDHRAFYTITAIGSNPNDLTLLNETTGVSGTAGLSTGDIVSEPAVYEDNNTNPVGLTGFVTDGTGATWTPALNSATSVTPGNSFIVNLKGLTSGDSAFVEILNTNPNELVKNYTYLNREFGVYVYCDSTLQCGAANPYSTATTAGQWSVATDVTGETINEVGDLLTLANARVQFNLIGDYVYAITIEGGALFTIDTSTGTGNSLSPFDQIGITAR